MSDVTVTEPVLLIALALGVFLLLALAAILVARAERGRAAAIASLARAEERVRAAEKAAADLDAARREIDAQGRSLAAQTADLKNAADRIAALQADASAATQEQRTLRSERDDLARTIERERAEARGLERRIADLMEAKEQLRQSFGETANALLQQHSENFKAQNSEQIGYLLTPLKNDIDAFKKSLGDAHVETSKQHGSLKEQIERLAAQSASVSKEAENLTRALKGDVQMQGAWGEMIVDTILQRLGLREGVEYTRQESFAGDDGRVRTDYIVNIPGGERIIIDSKVSLVDFEAATHAPEAATRETRLSAHARSMRTHVRTLSSKEYQARVGTRLDYVVMFVPIEAALGAALSADDALILDALDQKVAIATPTTLTTVMMTVASLWKVERQHLHAEEIASRAGKLYDKFAGFIGDVERIGDRLTQAQASFSGALTKLTGAGGLVRQAEMLRAMGAKTTKSLSQGIRDAAGVGDAEQVLALEMRDAEESGDDPSPLTVQ